jgi:hypothetical protein
LIRKSEAARVPELVRVGWQDKPGLFTIVADRQPCLYNFDFLGP